MAARPEPQRLIGGQGDQEIKCLLSPILVALIFPPIIKSSAAESLMRTADLDRAIEDELSYLAMSLAHAYRLAICCSLWYLK